MNKKILSIDDLLKFLQENPINRFDAKDTGYEIVVQVPATLEFEEDKDEEEVIDSKIGLLFSKLKVCHTNLNANGSYISESNMKKAMPSLKYRPLLAHIHQLNNGEYDFHSHDMEIDEDKNITYIEQQIGTITADEPYLEYDKDNDKTYVIAYAAIPEDYTLGAEIIRRKNGTKVSCELSIVSMSYNASEKYLELEDFYFTGVTCLGSEKNGKEIKEGMRGSRLDITDFSKENNSIMNYSTNNVNEKLVEVLDKLNITIETLSKTKYIENNKEGGQSKLKFKELLEKYNKTEEDITFEIDGLSDEELEAKFAEMFEEITDNANSSENAENTENSENTENTTNTDDTNDIDNNDGTDNNTDNNADNSANNTDSETNSDFNSNEGMENHSENVKPKISINTSNGEIKEFELSLDDIQYALYNIVNDTYSETDNTWYGVTVYDNNTLIMHDWWNDKNYRQAYKQENENFSLVGDREEVFSVWVNADEKESLAEMKANYNLIKEELASYKLNNAKIEKEKILAEEAYQQFIETDEFKSIINEMDNLSVEEFSVKCELAFAKLVKNNGTFALDTNKSKKTSNKVGVVSTFDSNENSDEPYGDYFNSLR